MKQAVNILASGTSFIGIVIKAHRRRILEVTSFNGWKTETIHCRPGGLPLIVVRTLHSGAVMRSRQSQPCPV